MGEMRLKRVFTRAATIHYFARHFICFYDTNNKTGETVTVQQIGLPHISVLLRFEQRVPSICIC